MAKSSRPGGGKSGALSNPSRKVKTAKGLSRNGLCALCFLFVHSLVFIPGGSKGKEESTSIKYFVVLSFPKKTLRSPRTLRLIFLFMLGERREEKLGKWNNGR
jgi:hypothetical protein